MPRSRQTARTAKRDEFWDGGQAVGSPSIAKKVKTAGGNAVIMQSQEEAGKSGGFGSGDAFYAWSMSGGSKTITRMLVVRYLPDDEPLPAQKTGPVPVK